MTERQIAIKMLTEYIMHRYQNREKTEEENMQDKVRFIVDFYNMNPTDIGRIRESYSETYLD